MSDENVELAGPDLCQGIPASALTEAVPLLGHAQGEPVIPGVAEQAAPEDQQQREHDHREQQEHAEDDAADSVGLGEKVGKAQAIDSSCFHEVLFLTL